MLAIRKSDQRGLANHGWLKSRHTFSFGHYYDRDFMGFGPLRVINEDRVEPGQGFGTHGHQAMEIISYVLDGALEHKDSTGTGSIIRPGDVQRMTAGTGVYHSEYNASKTDPVHFLQIWILPERDGLEPSYEQKAFSREEKQDRLRLVASRDGREGSITVHQDVDLYSSLLDAGKELDFELRRSRQAWIQVARGRIRVDGKELSAGDGLAVTGPNTLRIEGLDAGEFLLFDMGDGAR